MAAASPIPPGFNTLTPHLVVRNAAEAIDFYKRAFGAEERFRMMGPDGKTVAHAEVTIGNSVLMLCDEYPQGTCRAPQSLGGSSVVLHVYVNDADALFKRACDAGATPTMPVQDTFWGDRYGRLRDPFGHEWSIATHVKDLTPEEIARGAEEFFKNKQGCD